MDEARLNQILSRYDCQPADLIPVLQDIQDTYNYLPQEELQVVAARLQVPLSQVYSVATFFKMFSLVPKGKHICRVCLGTTCHLKGGQRLLEAISHRLGVEPGLYLQGPEFLPGDGGLPGFVCSSSGHDD